MTLYVDPRVSVQIDAAIRIEAERRGDAVMPRQPWPWHRREVRKIIRQAREEKTELA